SIYAAATTVCLAGLNSPRDSLHPACCDVLFTDDALTLLPDHLDYFRRPDPICDRGEQPIAAGTPAVDHGCQIGEQPRRGGDHALSRREVEFELRRYRHLSERLSLAGGPDETPTHH